MSVKKLQDVCRVLIYFLSLLLDSVCTTVCKRTCRSRLEDPVTQAELAEPPVHTPHLAVQELLSSRWVGLSAGATFPFSVHRSVRSPCALLKKMFCRHPPTPTSTPVPPTTRHFLFVFFCRALVWPQSTSNRVTQDYWFMSKLSPRWIYQLWSLKWFEKHRRLKAELPDCWKIQHTRWMADFFIYLVHHYSSHRAEREPPDAVLEGEKGGMRFLSVGPSESLMEASADILKPVLFCGATWSPSVSGITKIVLFC